jgi:hypothetical protein
VHLDDKLVSHVSANTCEIQNRKRYCLVIARASKLITIILSFPSVL